MCVCVCVCVCIHPSIHPYAYMYNTTTIVPQVELQVYACKEVFVVGSRTYIHAYSYLQHSMHANIT